MKLLQHSKTKLRCDWFYNLQSPIFIFVTEYLGILSNHYNCFPQIEHFFTYSIGPLINKFQNLLISSQFFFPSYVYHLCLIATRCSSWPLTKCKIQFALNRLYLPSWLISKNLFYKHFNKICFTLCSLSLLIYFEPSSFLS